MYTIVQPSIRLASKVSVTFWIRWDGYDSRKALIGSFIYIAALFHVYF